MKKRLLSLFFAVLIFCTLPLSAYAEFKDTYDIAAGSVNIYDVSAEQGGTTYEHAGAVTVTGSSTSNTVSVDVSTDVTVTLDNVNIDVSRTGAFVSNDPDTNPIAYGEAAMSVEASSGATVTVELDGTNILKSGCGQAGLAAVEGNLVIQDENDEDGSLTAAGGWCGAGIGGGKEITEDDYEDKYYVGCDSANITITGGTVNASSKGLGGSGIGGGLGGEASGIVISGDANVLAKGSSEMYIITRGGNHGTFKTYYGEAPAIGNGAQQIAAGNSESATVTNEQKEQAKGKAVSPDTSGLYCTGLVILRKDDGWHVSDYRIGGTVHDWDEGKVTKEPDIGVEGEKLFTCLGTKKGCTATKTEIIPALVPITDYEAFESSDIIYTVSSPDGGDIDFTETKDEGLLRIECEEENAVLTIYQLKKLMDSGIEQIIFKSAEAETALVLSDYANAVMPLTVSHMGSDASIIEFSND